LPSFDRLFEKALENEVRGKPQQREDQQSLKNEPVCSCTPVERSETLNISAQRAVIFLYEGRSSASSTASFAPAQLPAPIEAPGYCHGLQRLDALLAPHPAAAHNSPRSMARKYNAITRAEPT
jgi:hypothetical protein